MKEIVEILTQRNETIATMESCTGGSLVNEITNIPDASKIIKFSAVTYSNEFKIKMGVNSNTIDKYTVYSIEVAKEMSKAISNFTNSDYGVGITGQLKKIDLNNLTDNDNLVFVSIYDKNKDFYYTMSLEVLDLPRSENKKYVVNKIVDLLKNIIN